MSCDVGRVWRAAVAIGAALGIALAPWVSRADFVGQQRVASGLFQPLGATFAPGDPTRLFIITQPGVIRILNLATGVLEPTPFLTIADASHDATESGLLGLAFAPDYAASGKFYVNVTVDNDSGIVIAGQPSPFDTMIREYTVSANPNVANPTPRTILSIPQPREWHNGGWIGFSPRDEYLYVAMGDGGIGGMANPLAGPYGSILRIDVEGDDFPEDAARNYAIPADNPFVNTPEVDELWATGLRNPWRASFDRATGDLWIGDVGQNTVEEVNFQAADAAGGANYGWPLREGTYQNTGPEGGPAPPNETLPVYEYLHPAPGDVDPLKGHGVVGGYVYRGPDPTLRGTYVFGDLRNNRIFAFDPGDPAGTVENIWDDLPVDVGQAILSASFGEDYYGNLYVCYIASGEVYRLMTDTVAAGDFNGDGYVDGDDLAAWSAGFGTTDGADANDGDADGDGDVDGNDFLTWQRNVGTSPLTVGGDAVAAPEPGGIAIGLTAAAVGLRLSRSRIDVVRRVSPSVQ